MGWWTDYLFRIGYYPIKHQSVKQGFLQWYYQAAQSELVVEGLEIGNSQLVDLTLEAAQTAETIDSDHPTIKLFDKFEEYIKKMKIGLAYMSLVLLAFGAGTLAVSVYALDESILRWFSIVVGATLSIPPVGLSATYLILEHQLRSNAELVAKFNRKLIEKPGDVRWNDRRWDRLTAQYLWNRSLLRPRTIIVLILLSIIKVVRPGLYGSISGELQEQVREFVGEDGKTILKTEFERALQGKFITHESQSQNTLERTPRKSSEEKRF